jgi:hypothetical protein
MLFGRASALAEKYQQLDFPGPWVISFNFLDTFVFIPSPSSFSFSFETCHLLFIFRARSNHAARTEYSQIWTDYQSTGKEILAYKAGWTGMLVLQNLIEFYVYIFFLT